MYEIECIFVILGYVGNPLSGCRHECESDGECGSQENCKDFKCQQACTQCGIGASCVRVSNHRAICECPKVSNAACTFAILFYTLPITTLWTFIKTELLRQPIYRMPSWMLWWYVYQPFNVFPTNPTNSVSCLPFGKYQDRDCPAGRPACYYGVCKNPCDGTCGVNADCNLRGLTPICR